MAERTPEEAARVATIVAERAGVLGLARSKCRSIDAAVSQHRISADEATEAKRWINQFAGDVAIGLHVEGADDPEVRTAMKPLALHLNPIRHGSADPGERVGGGSSPSVVDAHPSEASL